MDIRFQQISLQFDSKPIFQNMNLTFQEERINCLMGASGKGKTTVLNLIMGLINPGSGQIIGCDKVKMSVVFQEDRLIEHWDASKNVKLVCDPDIKEDEIIKQLEKLEIDECTGKPVREFSDGMRRRVAIVRALMSDSELVILDEPFRGLDSNLKRNVIRYIKENTLGKTVIVVTHEIEDVMLLEGNLITL